MKKYLIFLFLLIGIKAFCITSLTTNEKKQLQEELYFLQVQDAFYFETYTEFINIASNKYTFSPSVTIHRKANSPYKVKLVIGTPVSRNIIYYGYAYVFNKDTIDCFYIIRKQ